MFSFISWDFLALATLLHNNWKLSWNLSRCSDSADQLSNTSHRKPIKEFSVPCTVWCKWNINIGQTTASWTKERWTGCRVGSSDPVLLTQYRSCLYGIRSNPSKVSVTTRRIFVLELFCRTCSVSVMFSVCLHVDFGTAEILLFDHRNWRQELKHGEIARWKIFQQLLYF